jgi:Fe-S cluster biogenesis protein NfuA
MLPLKEMIKVHVEEEKGIVAEGFEAEVNAVTANKIQEEYTGENAELVKKIKELIDTYVKPAVESDGGNIEFRSYDEGVVTVVLQGACSGCPSSTVTLKSGIEGMLKRMVPEVTEVVAEMG